MSDGGSSYPQGLFGRQDSFWLVRNGREHDLSKYYAFPLVYHRPGLGP